MKTPGVLHRDPIIELSTQQEDRAYRSTINAARTAYGSRCPECGSDDGTVQLAWFDIKMPEQSKPPLLFKYQDRDDALYTTCWCCNPRGTVMPGYTLVKWPEALAWTAEQKKNDPEEVAFGESLGGII